MKIYSASGNPRPIRLCEATRTFAFESLSGVYGDDAMKTPSVSVDDCTDWDNLSLYQRYDVCIDRIAREAPIRICHGERISGAATLGAAINHVIPVSHGGDIVFGSVSHVTLGFDRAVKYGIDSFEAQINTKLLEKELSTDRREILESMNHTISAMHVWHNRYIEALKDIAPDNYNNLRNVPFAPPSSFAEAVQSLWFCFAYTRLLGNWSGIGRIDCILGDYLKNDLKSGKITIDEAREILAHFFIKGCEWIRSDAPQGSGDAQHYQNIVLSGVDSDGNDITNEVTYLVLDIVEELPIGDFPITVRLRPDSPEPLFRRVAEVIRHGGGIVAIYNDPLITDALVDFGYPLREARGFANDGCWEVQIPGTTYFIYTPFDALQIFLHDTLGLGKEKHSEFDSYEELYSAFKINLTNFVSDLCMRNINSRGKLLPNGEFEWFQNTHPCSVISLFTEGCIENATSYLSGGPKYTVIAPHIGGAPDVANSLYAIKKLVFEEKRLPLSELIDILDNNWEGYEELRSYVRNKYVYYGNDNEEVDSIAAQLLDDFAEVVASFKGSSPILMPAGISTFGRQVDWLPYRSAVPFGYKRGDILAGNDSPTPGTDLEGATAVISSYCRANLKKQVNGAALDLKLHPSAVQGADGLNGIIALIKGFLTLGGYFMQIDCVDAETLRAAQLNPENYKSLSVRVSGWNARFITLNQKWQQMIIERTELNI